MRGKNTKKLEIEITVGAMREMAMRPHDYCEDPWYSCPKSEHGCANDMAGDDCNCGADKHNLGVERLYKETLLAIKILRQRIAMAERMCERSGGNSADCDLMAGQDIDDLLMAEHDRDKVAE